MTWSDFRKLPAGTVVWFCNQASYEPSGWMIIEHKTGSSTTRLSSIDDNSSGHVSLTNVEFVHLTLDLAQSAQVAYKLLSD